LYIRLECSWWNHPLARSKFTVISQKEIKTIKGIRKVKLFYDPELSDPEEEPEIETVPGAPDTAVGGPIQEDRRKKKTFERNKFRPVRNIRLNYKKPPISTNGIVNLSQIGLRLRREPVT